MTIPNVPVSSTGWSDECDASGQQPQCTCTAEQLQALLNGAVVVTRPYSMLIGDDAGRGTFFGNATHAQIRQRIVNDSSVSFPLNAFQRHTFDTMDAFLGVLAAFARVNYGAADELSTLRFDRRRNDVLYRQMLDSFRGVKFVGATGRVELNDEMDRSPRRLHVAQAQGFRQDSTNRSTAAAATDSTRTMLKAPILARFNWSDGTLGTVIDSIAFLRPSAAEKGFLWFTSGEFSCELSICVRGRTRRFYYGKGFKAVCGRRRKFLLVL